MERSAELGFNLTDLDYELADEISRVMHEERGDFHEASQFALNQFQVPGEEWGERLRNIGHILSQRRKTRLPQMTEDVSMLLHQGWKFESAMYRVLEEQTILPSQYKWYFKNVGRRLAAKKRKLADKVAKQAEKEARQKAAAEAKAVRQAEKAVARAAKSAGRKPAVAKTVALPNPPRPPGSPLVLRSVSLAEVEMENLEARARRKKRDERRASAPSRQQRHYDSAVEQKLFS